MTVPAIGVMFRREQPPEDLPSWARRVEAAGFDELWVVEDCFFSGGVAQAATALAATSRIGVGLGIAPAVARNAAFTAMEFATLARMAPGRFHGGLGHGVAAWMEQIGARPESWLAALEETTEAVRRLLAGERVTTAGRHVRLRDVELEHKPEAPPPVSLGVRGPRSLALSGRCADGTVLAEASAPAYIAWARDQIDAGRREAGREGPHRLTVYAFCQVNAEAPGAARATMRETLADFLGDGSASSQTAPLPWATELDVLIREGGAGALRRGLRDEWIDDLAIAGSPETCGAAIDRMRAAGADSIVLVPPPASDPPGWLDDIERQLLPALGRGR